MLHRLPLQLAADSNSQHVASLHVCMLVVSGCYCPKEWEFSAREPPVFFVTFAAAAMQLCHLCICSELFLQCDPPTHTRSAQHHPVLVLRLLCLPPCFIGRCCCCCGCTTAGCQHPAGLGDASILHIPPVLPRGVDEALVLVKGVQQLLQHGTAQLWCMVLQPTCSGDERGIHSLDEHSWVGAP